MGNIHILSEQLQNQIAAGEVVERPASVIKELVENALDSGATKIRIEVSSAGKESIVVSDNGCGMDQEDLEQSIKRFATSKIAKQEDLSHIQTFGFRGEALASISSVSLFEIQTRREDNNQGLKLTYDAKTDRSEIAPCGCPPGTRVEVKNLFEQTPARLKFLKSDSTELHHVLDTVENIVLINPHIDWNFVSNGKEVFSLPTLEGERSEILLKQIERVLSVKNREDLYKVESSSPILEISGYIGSPLLAKHNKKHQYLFINGRPIKNTTVSSAVQTGFKSLLPHGKYPFFVLDIEITADLIDVNVHPRKLEIRFQNSQQVFLAVKTAVEKAIQQMDLVNQSVPEHVAQFSQNASSNIESSYNSTPSYQKSNSFDSNSNSSYQNPIRTERNSSPLPVQDALEFSQNILSSEKHSPSVEQTEIIEEFQPVESAPRDRIIGQVRNAYIVVEKEEGMLILDQHAVHERIRYEMLMAAANEQSKIGQQLLLPETVELQHSHIELLKEYANLFENLGFDLHYSEDNLVEIASIPSVLEDTDIQTIFKGLVDDLNALDTTARTIENIKERAILFLSCKKAIKFGDSITHQEMHYLYQRWLKCEKKETCPHGRALSYFIPYKELDRLFDRT